MRVLFPLALAVFSLSAAAAFEFSGPAPGASVNGLGGVIDAARRVVAGLSADRTAHAVLASTPRIAGDRSVGMGDVIPETIPLHLIPKHETYRYAVVNDRGVIVDATSRQVVYVVR
jgi:hypothetical protein